nr:hypothetical protein [uncultured Mediterranean phage uvMED]
MSTITITQNGVSETRDIERTYSGTNTMTVQNSPRVSTVALALEVDGHSDLNGVYGKGGVGWEQNGGDGRIGTQGWNSESNYKMWFVYDDDDYDPSGDNDEDYTWLSFKDTEEPWSSLSSRTHKVQIKRAVEYITLSR